MNRDRIAQMGTMVMASFLLLVVLTGDLGGAEPIKYPTKTINWICMWPAGGGADTATRIFTRQLEKILGKTIVVQNMPGGGGSIGYLSAKNAKPDGYTLLIIQDTLPNFKPKGMAPINIADFDILGAFAFQAPIIVARSDTPWNTAKDFVEDAKKRPGKLTVGISDIGGGYHQPLLLWMDLGGFNVKAISHEGSPQQVAALLGGHVDVNITWIRPNIPYIKEKKLKFLGYMASERPLGFPEVPTLRELGYDVVFESPYGIGGPKGLPEDVKQVLSEATKKIWDIPEVRAELENLGLALFRKDGPAYTQHLYKMEENATKALRLLGEQPKQQ